MLVEHHCWDSCVSFFDISSRRAESDPGDSLVLVVRLYSSWEKGCYNCLRSLKTRKGFWSRCWHSREGFGFPSFFWLSASFVQCVLALKPRGKLQGWQKMEPMWKYRSRLAQTKCHSLKSKLWSCSYFKHIIPVTFAWHGLTFNEGNHACVCRVRGVWWPDMWAIWDYGVYINFSLEQGVPTSSAYRSF